MLDFCERFELEIELFNVLQFADVRLPPGVEEDFEIGTDGTQLSRICRCRNGTICSAVRLLGTRTAVWL